MALRRNAAEDAQPGEDPRLLSLAINETDRTVMILDRDRNIVYVNRAFTELFEYTAAEVIGKRPTAFLVGEKTDAATTERIQQKAAEKERFQEETLFYSKSGREIWISGTVNPIRDEQGQIINLVAVLADITETKKIHELQRVVLEAVASGVALSEVADLLCRHVEAIAPEVVSSMLLVDKNRKMLPLAGPRLPEGYSEALMGVEIGENVGSCGTAAHLGVPVCVTDIETDPRWENYKAVVLPMGFRACWSSPIKLRDGRVAGSFAFYYKEKRGPSALHKELVSVCLHLCMLAIERDEARHKISQLSHFDSLTGLPNRASFYEMANELLSGTKGEQSSFFALDLDRFKDINDTLGHSVGDGILIEVAYRLQRLLKPQGIVCRMAGNSFVLVLPGCGASLASAMADSMLDALKEPIHMPGISLSIVASIGISVTQGTDTSAEICSEQAVTALHGAKATGRACYHFYSPEMNQQAQERLILGAALRGALEEESLHLVYQPQFRLKTMELAGVEALSRWTDKKLGSISPGKFIPLAEEIGQIETIGYWSLQEACRQMSVWRKSGVPVPTVSVNLSPLHFRVRSLPKFVEDLLSEYSLPANCLTIEITESLMMDQNPQGLEVAKELHDIGCGLSIDDFGTGFSSFARLTRLPISELKLDQSFMRNFEKDRSAQAVATAVIRIGQSLGVDVVAEGVETEGQEQILASLGCDIVQGYLRGRPMPARELKSWLTADREIYS